MEASEFWEKIKKTLLEQGKSFDWLCNEAGVSVQVMRNRIYKERIPSVDDTLSLLNVLGFTVEEFYGLKTSGNQVKEFVMPDNSNQIPVFDQSFSAGFGQFVPDSDCIDGYITIPDDLNRYKGHLAASKVRGDSMEPTLHDGDTLICDDLGYKEDGIYVIIYKGKGYVKRLQQTASGVKIISDNPAYAPMEENGTSDDLLKVIGKVHYVLHKI